MYDMMQLSSRCLPVGLRVPEENGFPYEDILLTRPIFPEIYMYNDVLLLPGILISEVVTIQVSKAKPLSERKTCTCTQHAHYYLVGLPGILFVYIAEDSHELTGILH